MKSLKLPIVLTVALFLLVAVAVLVGFATSNTVPVSYMVDDVRAALIIEFAPYQCKSLPLTRLVVLAAGQSPQGNNSELILGTPGNDRIKALAGNDCVVGGGGNDEINGGQGDDVLIGGPGNADDLDGDAGTDTCIQGEILTQCE